MNQVDEFSNNQKRKKGFTLVELIVVIAIIAILATVSIISYTSFIDQAHRSNDQQDVVAMNHNLTAFFVQNGNINSSDLEASEVRYIADPDNSFSFIPRTSGYSFVYNQITGKIEIRDISSEVGLSSSVSVGGPGLNTLEEVFENHLLLDRGGSRLADIIYRIRTLQAPEQFGNPTLELTDYNAAIIANVTNYNPDNTLYINDFYSFTGSSDTISRIVFSDRIETIPPFAVPNLTIEIAFQLPYSISIIESNAFTLNDISINYHDLSRIGVEEGAFLSNSINTQLANKQGSVQLEKLNVSVSIANERIDYYHVEQGVWTFIGKSIVTRLSSTQNQIAFHNKDGGIVRTYYQDEEQFKYALEGENVSDQDTYEGYGVLDILESTSYRSQSEYIYAGIHRIERSVNVAVANSVANVHKVGITYRRLQDGSVEVLVKAYDERGNFFAKGKAIYLELFK